MQGQSMPGLCIGLVWPSCVGSLPTILPHLHFPCHLHQSGSQWLAPQQQPDITEKKVCKTKDRWQL